MREQKRTANKLLPWMIGRWEDGYDSDASNVDHACKDVMDGKINPFTGEAYRNDRELPCVMPTERILGTRALDESVEKMEPGAGEIVFALPEFGGGRAPSRVIVRDPVTDDFYGAYVPENAGAGALLRVDMTRGEWRPADGIAEDASKRGDADAAALLDDLALADVRVPYAATAAPEAASSDDTFLRRVPLEAGSPARPPPPPSLAAAPLCDPLPPEATGDLLDVLAYASVFGVAADSIALGDFPDEAAALVADSEWSGATATPLVL